jgi:hypothetical protein
LTAILLVVVVGTADPNEIALIVVSTVVGLLVGAAVKAVMARREAQGRRNRYDASREIP